MTTKKLIPFVEAGDELLSDYIKMLNDPNIKAIPKELQPEHPPGTCLIWPESDGDASDGWTLHNDGMRYIKRDA